MHVETMVAGFGGQGILFLGRVLATAGMIDGYHVSWFPSYGPEMRGGTANCVVIISDQEIGSTISDHPNVCIVMNEPSLRRYAPTVRPGGLLVVNSSLITQKYHDSKIQILEVPGNDIAGDEIGDPRTLNMVILGALIGYHSTVKEESIRQALEEILQGKKSKLIDINMKAFTAGKNSILRKVTE
ncbi:MAG TPA: 2-oxoacid:ferredoxin oxidoreductase subunit gamma [Candidatus Atribacteria bacterium]|nr:2-oxoacid:ferredoxin oxidoreductase subunit gamma [Candidatus Atribacteria bacterium]